MAIEKLLSNGGDGALAGNAYFISDGTPIDNFEFLRDLCVARDCEFPEHNVIPTSVLVVLGFLLEKLYFISSRLGHPIEPFLTRGEVYKVGVTHYFDISKSRKDFGYVPSFGTPEGAKRIAEYYKLKSSADNAHYFRFASWYWWILCVGGMSLTCSIAYQLVNTTPASGSLLMKVYGSLDSLALYLFRSRLGVQVVFWLATLAHVVETVIALRTANRIGCNGTVLWLWGFQTLCLGFSSLGFLQAREAKMAQIAKQN
jgi:hypothetical protein